MGLKRNYSYKDFEVVVELEAMWDAPRGVTLAAPRGYVAVVHIRRAGDGRRFVAPVRLMAEDQQPFGLEGEALMAGYSAAQRLIDDALAV